MNSLMPGMCGLKEMLVEEKDLSSVVGNIGVQVLSTHRLVLLMELASRSVVEPFLEKDQIVVGTWIGIRHLAAAPLGESVKVESTLREIDGRKLIFDVVAYDSHEKIAKGSNELLIVSRKKFFDRVQQKTVHPASIIFLNHVECNEKRVSSNEIPTRLPRLL